MKTIDSTKNIADILCQIENKDDPCSEYTVRCGARGLLKNLFIENFLKCLKRDSNPWLKGFQPNALPLSYLDISNLI